MAALSPTQRNLEAFAKTLEHDLAEINLAFVISDPRQPDNPIVYASDGFFKLTQYTPSEVLGKNCRFLQGPGTSRQAVLEIRDAIREERAVTVQLLNYRKDGTPFFNAFRLDPIYGSDGVVDYFIGVQYAIREDVSGLESVTRQEAAAADKIRQQVVRHSVELQQSQAGICAADHSLPSSLLCGFGRLQESFVLCDPNLPDCPMMYCSPSFLKLTGYSCTELLGVNCRLLQGPGTDRSKVEALKEAISADPPRPHTTTLLNYKKSGEPFWNCLHLSPVRDSGGKVRFIVGVQIDASTAAAPPGLDDAMLAMEGARGGPQEVLPSPMMLLRQKGIVGAIRVATRSLANQGLRRASADQHRPTTPLAP